jgi:hypothetical protein
MDTSECVHRVINVPDEAAAREFERRFGPCPSALDGPEDGSG